MSWWDQTIYENNKHLFIGHTGSSETSFAINNSDGTASYTTFDLSTYDSSKLGVYGDGEITAGMGRGEGEFAGGPFGRQECLAYLQCRVRRTRRTEHGVQL